MVNELASGVNRDRRAECAAMIGAALAAKASGLDIAVLLGRPAETVRSWLRRFAVRVESRSPEAVFTRWCRELAPDQVQLGPAGSAWADTLAPITAVAAAVVSRFGVGGEPSARTSTGGALREGRGGVVWAGSGSTVLHPDAG